jgi:glyceraldehyde 3-phosphate dehydrogenase
MTIICVGVNGLGRIGKGVLLQLLNDPTICIRAINVPSVSNDQLESYLNHDSIYQSTNKIKVTVENSDYVSIGRHLLVRIYHTRNVSELEWRDDGVTHLFECSGQYLTTDKAKLHDVDYLIMSAPPKDLDVTPMYCPGVNENNYNGESIISLASCTTNCLTPFLKKVIQTTHTLEDVNFITIHASTASQSIVDEANTNKRTSRSVWNNIIPHTTGAQKTINYLLPSIHNKVKGTSIRVPINTVSMIDVNIRFNEPVDKDTLLNSLATDEVFTISKEKLVSTDYIGSTTPSILDKSCTMQLTPQTIKFALWYDNEWSFCTQMIRMVKIMHHKTTKKHNSLSDIDFARKRVFIRCDFNCPEGDDFRIHSAIPTIQYILKQHASHIILATHYGRPINQNEYSTRKFIDKLENLLNTKVNFLPRGLDSTDNQDIIENGVYLMENTRYHDYETKPRDDWHQGFYVDVFCNEAFSCSHRNHTSMTKIQAKEMCLGLCFEKEINALDLFKANQNTIQKVNKMVIFGGNKIDDKLPMLRFLANTVDVIFLAGNTLNHREDYAHVLKELGNKNATLILAEDGFGNVEDNEGEYIPDINKPNVNWIIKDVGPKTILTLQKLIATMDIVFWNGTLGIVESPTYKRGSLLLLHALEHCKANVIIGGGDTAGFVNQYPNTLSHISTGGGASIHYLGN